jgi:hypothetical protein
VLPRISTAFAQFIQPVASSSAQARPKSKREEPPPGTYKDSSKDPQPESKRDPKQPPEPQPDNVISFPKPQRGALPKVSPDFSVSQAFIQMLAAIQERRMVFMKWLGHRSYQRALKDGKKGAHFSKGSMLDHQAK